MTFTDNIMAVRMREIRLPLGLIVILSLPAPPARLPRQPGRFLLPSSASESFPPAGPTNSPCPLPISEFVVFHIPSLPLDLFFPAFLCRLPLSLILALSFLLSLVSFSVSLCLSLSLCVSLSLSLCLSLSLSLSVCLSLSLSLSLSVFTPSCSTSSCFRLIVRCDLPLAPPPFLFFFSSTRCPAERSGAHGPRTVYIQPKLYGDRSVGGAMQILSGVSVEFQGGVTATGNSAKEGGAFFLDE